MGTADPEVTAAAQAGTCALSDAMDALALSGVLPGLRALSGVATIAGRAVTVELAPFGTPARGDGPARHLCTAAVDSAGPGDVIVIAHPGPHDGAAPAGWGGILSLAAHLRGVEGTVVGGSARDVDEARELGYPVFGLQPTPVTARGRVAEIAWGEPIVISGVTVRPGDVIVADENSVICIPADHAAEVIDKAQSIVTREAAISAAVRSGVAVSEAMGANYEQMLA